MSVPGCGTGPIWGEREPTEILEFDSDPQPATVASITAIIATFPILRIPVP